MRHGDTGPLSEYEMRDKLTFKRLHDSEQAPQLLTPFYCNIDIIKPLNQSKIVN